MAFRGTQSVDSEFLPSLIIPAPYVAHISNIIYHIPSRARAGGCFELFAAFVMTSFFTAVSKHKAIGPSAHMTHYVCKIFAPQAQPRPRAHPGAL